MINQEGFMIFKAHGHAHFAEYGQDIVCAGISSIIFGALNALDSILDDVTIQVDDNEIVVTTKCNDEAEQLFRFLVIQLKTVQVSYPQYISIEESR